MSSSLQNLHLMSLSEEEEEEPCNHSLLEVTHGRNSSKEIYRTLVESFQLVCTQTLRDIVARWLVGNFHTPQTPLILRKHQDMPWYLTPRVPGTFKAALVTLHVQRNLLGVLPCEHILQQSAFLSASERNSFLHMHLSAPEFFFKERGFHIFTHDAKYPLQPKNLDSLSHVVMTLTPILRLDATLECIVLIIKYVIQCKSGPSMYQCQTFRCRHYASLDEVLENLFKKGGYQDSVLELMNTLTLPMNEIL